MADMMTFPKTFEEFINEYEFTDSEEIYTNGAELIPSFRVMQAWEHYSDNIKNKLNNIHACLKMIKNNLIDIEEEINDV